MKISVMLKPVSCSCNLNCKYCFYNSLVKERAVANYGIMNYDTLRNIVIKALAYANGDDVYFSVQGGEPLLAGIEFFNNIEKLFKEFNTKGSEIIFAVQTNGTLINDEFCEFFQRNNCLLGISLDGDAVANANRVDKAGNPTFDIVMNNIELLEHYHIDYNILTVVTKYVATHAKDVYNFFKGQGFKYLQFTPCLKPYGKQRTNRNDYMDGIEYGNFLIELTRCYFNDYMSGNYISIRQLDSFVRLVAGKTATQCGMNGVCSLQFCLEADGSVFPCDFYCLDEWKLGNINEDTFENFAVSKKEKKFLAESLDIKDECKRCKYWALCKNGCKRERGDVDKCTAYKMYFKAMLPYLKILTSGVE